MLDAGAGVAIFAGCDGISLDLGPSDSLVGGLPRFGLNGMSQIHVDFFGSDRNW